MLSRIVAESIKSLKELLREILIQTQKTRQEWDLIHVNLKHVYEQLNRSLENEKICKDKLKQVLTSKNKQEIQLAINDCLFYLSH